MEMVLLGEKYTTFHATFKNLKIALTLKDMGFLVS